MSPPETKKDDTADMASSIETLEPDAVLGGKPQQADAHQIVAREDGGDFRPL